MNMSLNHSQPKKLGRKPGTDPKKVDRLLAIIQEAVQKTGAVPGNSELSLAMGVTPPTVIKIWRMLVAQGRISTDIQVLRAKNKQRKVVFCAHSGDCTPETAQKLFNLLKNDMEARIAFFELSRGNLRKDLK